MCSLISLMYTVYIYIRMTALKDMLKTTTCQHGKADGMMLFLACHSLFVMSIIMHTNETHFVFIFWTSVTHRWVCFLFTLKWSSCVEFHSLSSILCKRTLSFQYRLMCSLMSLMYTVYIYIYTHDSTPARPSGRHDVVFDVSLFVCDVNYHAHPRDSLCFYFLNFSYI